MLEVRGSRGSGEGGAFSISEKGILYTVFCVCHVLYSIDNVHAHACTCTCMCMHITFKLFGKKHLHIARDSMLESESRVSLIEKLHLVFSSTASCKVNCLQITEFAKLAH